MPKKILLLNGHPKVGSFSDALADAYQRGALAAGHEVVRVNLRDLHFDAVGIPAQLEPDLVKQQELITWCNHLVITTPVWWMSVPALLKGYLDRVLLPGFAFRYKKGLLWNHIPRWRPFLKGRSARVLYTQGGRDLTIRFGVLDNFWMGFKYGVIWFCGFSPVRRMICDNMSSTTPQRRERWLKKAYRLGQRGR